MCECDFPASYCRTCILLYGQMSGVSHWEEFLQGPTQSAAVGQLDISGPPDVSADLGALTAY